MLLLELKREAVRVAKAAKENVCRRSPHDISPQILAFRGDQLVAIVTLAKHARDEILDVFGLCAAGFGADSLACIFETWVASYGAEDKESWGKNPVTGKNWRPGEMQELVEKHNAIEKGWITEALGVTAANRAGDILYQAVPFRYSGKHLVWVEDDEIGLSDENHDHPARGYMADVMVKVMNAPDADTVVPQFMLRSTRDERDVLTAQLLMAKVDCVVILAGSNSDRVKFLRQHGMEI